MITKLAWLASKIWGRVNKSLHANDPAGIATWHTHRQLYPHAGLRPYANCCPRASWRAADAFYTAMPEAQKQIWRDAVKKPHMSGYDLWMKESLPLLTRGLHAPDTPSSSGGYTASRAVPGFSLQNPETCSTPVIAPTTIGTQNICCTTNPAQSRAWLLGGNCMPHTQPIGQLFRSAAGYCFDCVGGQFLAGTNHKAVYAHIYEKRFNLAETMEFRLVVHTSLPDPVQPLYLLPRAAERTIALGPSDPWAPSPPSWRYYTTIDITPYATLGQPIYVLVIPLTLCIHAQDGNARLAAMGVQCVATAHSHP